MNKNGNKLADFAIAYTVAVSAIIQAAALYNSPIGFEIPLRSMIAIAVRLFFPATAIACVITFKQAVIAGKQTRARALVAAMWVLSALVPLATAMTTVPLFTLPYIPAALALAMDARKADRATKNEALSNNG